MDTPTPSSRRSPATIRSLVLQAAWPVIFLASDESAYMSGVCFPTADGGQHARTSIPFRDTWSLDQQGALG
jgi:hypothetical protein